jgi:uncharacterized protein involved in outer membrane biogenesis
MKKVLIGVAALVVLAVAAILVGPSFVDWNRYKPEIAARAKAATGRDLVIDGDISLSILPSPTLAVEQVRFTNIEGGSGPDMATLEALEVHVALMPLLQGEIQVESVSLVRPVILLERLPDGRANWEIAGADAAGSAESGTATEGDGPAIRLDSVEIEDGTLIYRDAAADTEERIEALSASISAGSLQGPFTVAGTGRARGIPLEFDAGSGALADGQPVPVSLSLAIPDTDAKASFGGTLRTGAEGTALSGKLQAEGSSLARLIAALSPGAVLPASLADGFAVDARVEYAEPFADLQGLTLRLGETTATGTVTVDTGAPLFAKAELKLNRLDLDKLMAATATAPEGEAGAPADAETGVAPAPAPGGAFTLPRTIGGELELAIDAIGYGGGVISDARLSAALADGEIIITRASALLPGGSDLAVAGTIDAEGGQPRFAGAVEASSDNLRGLLDWLKVPLPEGAASDRLRKLSMTTRVTATPSAVQVADIDLRVDASRVTGGIAIALPEAGKRAKPGFGIGLAIDKLNLDGYLGATGEAPASTEAASAEAGATQTAAGGLPLDVLKPLAAFDANVELRVGSLTFHEQTMQGLHVDGTLQAGNLTLRDLSVQEFAGGKGALSGTLTDLAGSPRFDTKIDVAISDAGRALQFAGIDIPGRSKLGRLKLNGTLAGGADDVAYDATFSIGGIGAEGQARGSAVGFSGGIPRIDTDLDVKAKDAGPLLELAGLAGAVDAKLGALSLTGKAASGADDLTYDLAFSLSGVGGAGQLAGKITALSSATPQVDTRLDLKAEKPAGLLRLAGVDAATAGKLGALGVEGTMAGGTDAMRLDLALVGLNGTAKVAGTVSAAATPATFDLAVEANHPELRQLLAAVAEDYKPAGETLGAFHLTTKAVGSTESANLTDLVLEAGESRLNGTVSYEALGALPMVIAALTGNSLDLSGFMPAEGKSGGGSGSGGSGGSGGTGPWSREPLDLSVLDAVDADIDVAAASVILDDARIDDLKAKLSLRDGILTVTSLTGNTYGGSIDVKGQLAGRGVPSASGTVVATNLDSGELMKAGFLGSRITGPVNVTADLKTLGVSLAELMEGLNGTGNVGGTITVLTQTEQQVGSALLNILGTKVKEIKGLTDTVDTVFSAFAGSPSTLSGDFIVTNGVLDTENTQLANASAKLLAQGQADLGAWTMDMLANIFRLPSDSPYLTVGLNGVLNAPNAKFTGGGLSGGTGGTTGGVLQQIVPGLSGESGSGTTTAPGGALGGVLQQVIPGLNGQQGESAATSPTTTPDSTAPGALGTEVAPEAVPAPEAAPVPEVAPAPEAATAPAEAAPEVAPAPAEEPAVVIPEEPAQTTPEAAPEAVPEAAPAEAAPGATGTEPAPAAEVAPEAAPEAAPAEAAPAPEETAPVFIPPDEEVPAEPGAAEPGAAEPGVEGVAPGAGGTEPGADQSGLEQLLPGQTQQ